METIESKVIELAKAICRLRFYDDIDATAAIAKLNSQGLPNVSVKFVQAIYERLIEETDESKTIETIEKRVLDLTRAICELHRYDQTEDSTAIRNLEEQGFKEVSVEFVRAVYDQLEKEQWHQNADKSMYYTCVLPSEESFVMWSQRYLLSFDDTSTEGDSHQVQVFDCYNDKSIQFSIEKSATTLYSIHYLSGCFGIIVERDEDAEDNTRHVVSLIFLDLYRLNCKKLQTVEYVGNYIDIVTNKFDPTEFVLRLSIGAEHFSRICKIIGKEIVVGDPIQLPYPCSYFEGRFYGLLVYANQSGLIRNCKLFVYNVEQRTEERVDVDLPEGYYGRRGHLFGQLVGDNILVTLRFVHGGSVIARLNVPTRQWAFFDFSTKGWIRGIRVLDGNDLIVRTLESKTDAEGQVKDEFSLYKISIRKPELLQNMAWIVLVKMMQKRDTLKGAYESARRYLPYNSFIRCPFVKPDEHEKD